MYILNSRNLLIFSLETASNAVEFVEQMREENAQQRRELEHLRHTHTQVLHQFHALREGWMDFLREFGVTLPALPPLSFPSPVTFPSHATLPSPTTFPLSHPAAPTSPSRQPPPAFLDAHKPSTTPSSLARSPSATRYANVEDGERNVHFDSPSPLSRFSHHSPSHIPRSIHSPTYKRRGGIKPTTNLSSSNDILASLQDIEDKLSQIKMENKHSDLSLSPSPSSKYIYSTPSSPTHASAISNYSSLSFTYDDEPSLFATPRARLTKSQDAAPRTQSPKKGINSNFDAATHARIAKSGQTTHLLLDEVEQMEKMMKRWSSLDVDDFILERGAEMGWREEEEEEKGSRREDGRNERPKRRSVSSIGGREEREIRDRKGRDRGSKEYKDTQKGKSRDRDTGKDSEKERDRRIQDRDYLGRAHDGERARERDQQHDKIKEKERLKARERERDRDRDREKERERERERVRDRERIRERERERDRERERERDRDKHKQRDANHVDKYDEYLHGPKNSSEEETWRPYEKRVDIRGRESENSTASDEERNENDSDSYLSSDASQPHPPLFSPPPPPPHFRQKEPKKKRRDDDDEGDEQQLSPRSLLPHLLDEIKTHALRNSSERVDAIAAIEANRRNNVKERVDTQTHLMEQIKALKPNSGARLAAIQDAEVNRNEAQEAKRQEFMDSFARRSVLFIYLLLLLFLNWRGWR
jgi:hypothetical protein